MEIEDKVRRTKWNGSRSKRETNKKTYNEVDIFQFPGHYRTYYSERKWNGVRNFEYGGDSLEDIGPYGREIWIYIYNYVNLPNLGYMVLFSFHIFFFSKEFILSESNVLKKKLEKIPSSSAESFPL